MHCFYCCKEALEEFYDLEDDDYAAVFSKEPAQELTEHKSLSESSYLALEAFFISRMGKPARFQVIETDEEDRPYSVLTCFMHWFEKQ